MATAMEDITVEDMGDTVDMADMVHMEGTVPVTVATAMGATIPGMALALTTYLLISGTSGNSATNCEQLGVELCKNEALQ